MGGGGGGGEVNPSSTVFAILLLLLCKGRSRPTASAIGLPFTVSIELV